MAFQRQIKEKRTIVLPIIIEDCEPIPLLGSKHYADFRGSFEFGLGELIKAIKHFSNLSDVA